MTNKTECKLIEEAITAHWGDRCEEPIAPDPDDPSDPGCPICNAWAEFDRLVAAATATADNVTM